MDFLSTPLFASTGTEETVEKRYVPWNKGYSYSWHISDEVRLRMSLAGKGRKKSAEHRAKIGQAGLGKSKYLFKGKTPKQWSDILKTDYAHLVACIKNGTMDQVGAYREYIGKEKLPNSHTIYFMTPKGIMNYKQAKEAFGYSQSETIRNRLRSTNPKYSDWYFLDEREYDTDKEYMPGTLSWEGRTVSEWAKLLKGDVTTIREHIRDRGHLLEYRTYIKYMKTKKQN